MKNFLKDIFFGSIIGVIVLFLFGPDVCIPILFGLTFANFMEIHKDD